MMSLLVTFVVSKGIFLVPFQYSLMTLLPCFLIIPWFEIFLKEKKINPNGYNAPMYLWVSSNIISNVLVPIVRKENFHVQPSTLNVLNIHFQHPCYCLVRCGCPLLAFPFFLVILHLWSTLVLFGRVFIVEQT